MQFRGRETVCRFCLALMLSGCAASPGLEPNPDVGPPPSSSQGQPVPITQPELQVSAQDDSSLTREERVERMDRALQRSLNKVDARRKGATPGGEGPPGTAAGAAGSPSTPPSGGDSPEAGSGDSVASSEISGTEVPAPGRTDPDSKAPTDVTARDRDLESASTTGESEVPPEGTASRRQTGRQPAPGTGNVPEDIPPADNDSILETQIREAAMREKDPEMRKRLWNEYRRYKGLPTK